MDSNCGIVNMEEQLDLPPGFRFHPTDEELITYYLSKKVLDCNFTALAIGEVDMNKVEPWELPWRAKLGEKEWYFFCMRDKKYPTGLRTNRATASGYWKATGKDKEIYRGKNLVGMKKTLVFYKGRAPKGEKSNWVSHEYRLEGKFSLNNLPKQAKNDWVISRVFHKTNGGKKVHISALMRTNEMPPLTDPSKPDPTHVHCFSNSIVAPDDQKIQDDFIACLNNPMFSSSSNPADSFSRGQFNPVFGGLNPGFVGINYGQNMNLQGFRKVKEMVSLSQETENSSGLSNIEMGKKSFEENEGPSTSVGPPQDLDCIWRY